VLEFIEFPVFTRRLHFLAKDRALEVLTEIQNDLIKNPARGKIVEGTAGVRKARATNPERQKGTRGGFRYLYYYIARDAQIFLLMIFSKDEQDDLTSEQKKLLAAQIRGLRAAKEGQ
jgi:hypothetical protein